MRFLDPVSACKAAKKLAIESQQTISVRKSDGFWWLEKTPPWKQGQQVQKSDQLWDTQNQSVDAPLSPPCSIVEYKDEIESDLIEEVAVFWTEEAQEKLEERESWAGGQYDEYLEEEEVEPGPDDDYQFEDEIREVRPRETYRGRAAEDDATEDDAAFWIEEAERLIEEEQEELADDRESYERTNEDGWYDDDATDLLYG
jgi:hypothetical protein